jgi:5-formyltetrahydrofolate cyclo-ligase
MGEQEPGVSLEKSQLRNYVSRLRERLTSLEVEDKSSEILDQVLDLHEFLEAKTIACYVSKNNEVETRQLIRRALVQKKRVAVPMVNKDSLELKFSEIKNLGAELAPGNFGVLEPRPEYVRPVGLAAIDVMLVPGIVWDHEGYRIGWGRGYFDRTLKMLPETACSIGLGFDLQLIQHIPRSQFDVPVKIVVTESRMIRCK